MRLRYIRNWLTVAILRSIIGASKLLPYETRMRVGASSIAAISAIPPHAREPILAHTRLIYPEWSDDERNAFLKENLRHFGQNLMELYNIEDFSARQARFHVSGDGFESLKAQQAGGKGAIIVSGHFGHWEAIRAYWNANGMPLGAVYKKNANRYYEAIFAKALQYNGPAVHTGVRGLSNLMRILRAGGFISLLHDQKLEGAPLLPFLGQDVHTSLAAAEMALKYDVPLIPAYAIRRDNEYDYDLVFEAPIPPSDAETMTRAMNASLEARIRAHPAQWLWVYDRWTIFDAN